MTNFVGMRVVFMEIKSGMDFVVNVIEKFINKLNKFKKHMMEKQCEKILDIIFKLNTTGNTMVVKQIVTSIK
jgi:hypothetical protein